MHDGRDFKKPTSLSDAELVALLMCSTKRQEFANETAQDLLTRYGNLKNLLNVDAQQLAQIKNIGPIGSYRIRAACEIFRRIYATQPKQVKIVNAQRIHQVLKGNLFAKTKEHLYLLSLDSRKVLMAKDLVSIGTVNEATIHPREVYRQALLRNAVSIALAHNHPSGTLEPSLEDINVTQRIAGAGVILGIPLLDHLIIFDNSYTSMKELNLVKGGDNK